jgi:hypothetical protein
MPPSHCTYSLSYAFVTSLVRAACPLNRIFLNNIYSRIYNNHSSLYSYFSNLSLGPHILLSTLSLFLPHAGTATRSFTLVQGNSQITMQRNSLSWVWFMRQEGTGFWTHTSEEDILGKNNVTRIIVQLAVCLWDSLLQDKYVQCTGLHSLRDASNSRKCKSRCLANWEGCGRGTR